MRSTRGAQDTRPRRPAGGAALAIVAMLGLGCRDPATAPPPPTPPAAAPTGLAEVGPPAPPPEPPARAELRHAVDLAGGPAALDPLALLAHVDARVRAVAPDAVLLMLRCTRMRGGTADLTITADSRCTYEYRSPARSQRPADLPDGVRADLPCQLAFSVDAALSAPAPIVHSYRLDDCRRRIAVRPPACSLAEVWQRAIAAGIPADAVVALGFASRYRSGYDPIDPADDPDRPERGGWSLDVERDDGRDLRVRFPDDCGHTVTAAERAIATAFDRAAPRLRRCYQVGAGGHPAVEAFEQIWRLTVDAGGVPTVDFSDPGVDIEGMFAGDLDALRARFATCAAAVVRTLRLPPALPALRVELRVDAARLELAPPPYD